MSDPGGSMEELTDEELEAVTVAIAGFLNYCGPEGEELTVSAQVKLEALYERRKLRNSASSEMFGARTMETFHRVSALMDPPR